jgi:murein hydrolase activator
MVNGLFTIPVTTLAAMPRIPPFIGKGARSAAAFATLAAATLLAHPLLAEQPLRIAPPGAAAAEHQSAREKELEKLRAEQRQAAENQERLKAEIEGIGQDQRQLSRSLIETAARLREVEARAVESEARLAALDASERKLREALQGRHSTIAELLAALQRMGRRPPPALIVRPEDALAAVRSAIMLGAVLPEMRVEAEALASELAELVRVRREIAVERASLDSDLAALSGERQRLALLVEQRQKRQAEAEKELESERQRARALARQAQDVKDLVARLEENAASAKAAARVPEIPPRDIPRLAPAIAFADAKGLLRLPVNGVRLREFGAQDTVGNPHRGLSIATRTGAQVTAPSDGWVVYAGPFRSYGQLLILNAGGGYHILLAGMERISVDHGQFVLTGEPVATMGGGARAASAVAIGSSQPVLYIEFRKDGSPVDPGPWWAVTDSEKVRG